MLVTGAILQSDLHNLPETIELSEQALDLCDRLQDPLQYWSVWNNLSGALTTNSFPTLALSAAEVAADYASKVSADRSTNLFLAYSLSNAAYASVYLGCFAFGLRAAQQANEIFQRVSLMQDGNPHRGPELVARVLARCIQARLLLRIGLVGEAQGHIATAEALVERSTLGRATWVLGLAKALYRVYSGRAIEGIRDLEHALASVKSLSPELVADALRDLVEACSVTRQHQASSEYRRQLARHTHSETSASTLFHHRRHLQRLALGSATGTQRINSRGFDRTADRFDPISSGSTANRTQVLEDLCAVAELHDDPSGTHPHRVGELARLLAERSGLGASECAAIATAARLHDIGKIGVPPEILRKPGPLDVDEMDIVRSHAHAGAELLESTEIEDRAVAVDIARHHHEWWSGAGYPSRLAGEAIPMAARIVSLAEVFDALTHDRPYRPRLSIDRALELIEERSGRQFDPSLARQFSTLVRELQAHHTRVDLFLEQNVKTKGFLGARNRIALRFVNLTPRSP